MNRIEPFGYERRICGIEGMLANTQYFRQKRFPKGKTNDYERGANEKVLLASAHFSFFIIKSFLPECILLV